MIPKLNNSNWYREPVYLSLNRLHILSILGSLELSVRHSELPGTTHNLMTNIGKTLASILIDEGIIVPDEILGTWEKAFNMKCKAKPAKDLKAVYLDNCGRFLK